ncbi:helix-turn-helix domain-containing protein [Nesterenkonia alkaliphila]|uniref:helix-turn-helix domain-containing protein n=1 Tax=Nesterenkonia alkaliphila TaxID=1463631 RepID=UPI001E29A5CB|nr:helix-turn-helix transcriptional regulator [Nesterenkonia alkaliphila]
MFQTSELLPLLEERGIHMTREYVYRLVTKTPQRLNTEVFVALCDALACTPGDLITRIFAEQEQLKTGTSEGAPQIGDLRPVRAKIRRPDGVTEWPESPRAENARAAGPGRRR